MGITRAAIRQEVGRLTGDMLKVTATAAGTTTTFIDALRLARGDGNMVGRIGWMAAGTSANLYNMVRISASDKALFKVTFADTPLPSATATNDVMELWNRGGQGFYPDDVNSEINSALAIVSSLVTTPAETTLTFDSSNPYLTIPASWKFFGGALYQTDAQSDIWYEVPQNGSPMVVDTRNGTVRIKGNIASLAHGQSVKLFGDIESTPLTTDTDSTSCDAEWLTAYVAYRLLLEMMGRVSADSYDDVSTRMALCERREKESRAKARNRPQGAGIRIW